ncbi:MAG: DUF2093 domain-containing protein [Pseudomonadota bacterium]
MLFGKREAKLVYTQSSFRVVQPGDYVRCAVSGAEITLEALRYWSADRQEPYASGEISAQRHQEVAGQ